MSLLRGRYEDGDRVEMRTVAGWWLPGIVVRVRLRPRRGRVYDLRMDDGELEAGIRAASLRKRQPAPAPRPASH